MKPDGLNTWSFRFGNILEEVKEYKYLKIDFNNKLNWEHYKKKRILGRWKALYALQNRCREAELWDWKTIKVKVMEAA